MLTTRNRRAEIVCVTTLVLSCAFTGCTKQEEVNYAPEHRLVSIRMDDTDIGSRVIKRYNFEFGLSSDDRPQPSDYDILFSDSYPIGDTLRVRPIGGSIHLSTATSLFGIKEITPAVTQIEILSGREVLFVVTTHLGRIAKCRVHHVRQRGDPIIMEYALYRDPTPDLTLN